MGERNGRKMERMQALLATIATEGMENLLGHLRMNSLLSQSLLHENVVVDQKVPSRSLLIVLVLCSQAGVLTLTDLLTVMSYTVSVR